MGIAQEESDLTTNIIPSRVSPFDESWPESSSSDCTGIVAHVGQGQYNAHSGEVRDVPIPTIAGRQTQEDKEWYNNAQSNHCQSEALGHFACTICNDLVQILGKPNLRAKPWLEDPEAPSRL